jgi:hypothetical protein
MLTHFHLKMSDGAKRPPTVHIASSVTIFLLMLMMLQLPLGYHATFHDRLS